MPDDSSSLHELFSGGRAGRVANVNGVCGPTGRLRSRRPFTRLRHADVVLSRRVRRETPRGAGWTCGFDALARLEGGSPVSKQTREYAIRRSCRSSPELARPALRDQPRGGGIEIWFLDRIRPTPGSTLRVVSPSFVSLPRSRHARDTWTRLTVRGVSFVGLVFGAVTVNTPRSTAAETRARSTPVGIAYRFSKLPKCRSRAWCTRR